MLLSQVSLDSRRAAKPTPRSSTRITRVPRWKRIRLIALFPNKGHFILPTMITKNDSLLPGGASQAC